MFASVLPTPFYKGYTDLSSAIVCATDDPSGKGRSAIGITVAVAGTAVLRPPWGAGDGSNDTTVTIAAGHEPLLLEIGTVVSGTATGVTLIWARGVK